MNAPGSQGRWLMKLLQKIPIGCDSLQVPWDLQIKLDMNSGIFLDEALENGHRTDFCIGVAGYPEKLMEAPSLERYIQNLKVKQAAGADYVVTQMFYDNERFFEFSQRCRDNGITIPIIPGLKPVSSKGRDFNCNYNNNRTLQVV